MEESLQRRRINAAYKNDVDVILLKEKKPGID